MSADDQPKAASGLKDTLIAVAEALYGNSTKEQLSSLSLLLEVLAACTHSAETASLVTKVVYYSSPERMLHRSVEALIEAVAKNVALFVVGDKEALGYVSKIHASQIKKLANADHLTVYVVVRRFLVFLLSVDAKGTEQLMEEANIQSAFTTCVSLFDRAFEGKRTKNALLRLASRVAMASPTAAALLSKAVTEKETPPHGAVESVARQIFELSVGKKGEEGGEAVLQSKGDVIKKYVQTVLDSKKKVPVEVQLAFRPLFSVLTHEEFSEVLLPPMTKALKRSPDSTLAYITDCMANVKIDLSRYTKGLLVPAGVELLKSAAAETRAGAVQLFKTVATQSSDIGPIVEVLEDLLKPLIGGTLPNAVHRLGTLEGAAALLCVNAPAADRAVALGPLLKSAGPVLMKTVRSEINEDARIAAILTMGQFLAASGAPAAQCTEHVANLATVFSDKKNSDKLKAAVISSIALVADAKDLQKTIDPKPFEPLIAPIAALLPTANAKPAARAACLDAWRVCLFLEDAGLTSVPAKLKEGACLSLLTAKDSYLNDPQVLAKAPLPELESHIRLVSLVLSRHPPSVGPTTLVPLDPKDVDASDEATFPLPPTPESPLLPGVTGFHQGLVHLLLAYHQRKLAAPASEQPTDGTTAASTAASDSNALRVGSPASFSLDSVLAHVRDLPVLAKSLIFYLYHMLATHPADSAPLDPHALRTCLRDILRFVGNATGDAHTMPAKLGASACAVAVLCACHPLLESGGMGARGVWKWLSKGWGSDLPWDFLKTLILRGSSIPENDPSGFRQACLSAVACMDVRRYRQPSTKKGGANGRTSDEHVAALESAVGELIEGLKGRFNVDRIAKETEWNVRVYFWAEGSLCIEEGVYVAQEVEVKNIKANKFLEKLYGEGATELLMEASKEANKPKPSQALAAKAKTKPGAGGAAKKKDEAPKAMTRADIEAEQINEQTFIRNRTRVRVDQCTFCLDALVTCFEVSPLSVVESLIADLPPTLYRLLGSPLTSLRTLVALRKMVSMLVPLPIVPLRSYLPDALLMFATDTPVAEKTLEMLATISERVPLTPCAFAFVLPVISSILGAAAKMGPKACNQAMSLIAHQLKLRAKMNCHQVLGCIGAAMHTYPALVTSAEAALCEICEYLLVPEAVIELCEMAVTEDEKARAAVVRALKSAVAGDCDCVDVAAPYLYVLAHDAAMGGATAEKAKEVLALAMVGVTDQWIMQMCQFLTKTSSTFQQMASRALASLLRALGEEHGEDVGTNLVDQTIEVLRQVYFEPPSETMRGVAFALQALPNQKLITTDAQISKVFDFLLTVALDNPDINDQVELRDNLLQVGLGVVEQTCEGDALERQYTVLSGFLDTHHPKNPEAVGLAVAVLLGGIAKHMDPTDPKVAEVLGRLIDRLLDAKSPSESVQRAVAKVLPPLVKSCAAAKTYSPEEGFDKMLAAAFSDQSGVIRTGGALGVGAIVKGMGITAIKQLDVIKKLQDAAENKPDANKRQGALLCFEALSDSLGRLFEPYVIHILPILLNALSDGSLLVRTAAQHASKAIMAQLSAHGVKMVLPALLGKITDKQWRTKLGSIELLGAMANCAPKQLAACLPQVVPALCEVVSDTHPKVKEAANDALKTIGSVITNPEILALVPRLIGALVDPVPDNTRSALDALLSTSFVHSVDAPSLALVCPIVTRAMKERGSEAKKKASQIVASMVLLINDAKDFMPYYPAILPHLKGTLVDPIPDVRSVAAKACGTIAGRLGEGLLGDLLPWLFSTLKSSESSVERSGAANGLSEVLVALGPEKLQHFLPDILNNANDVYSPADVREGYLGLFVFLPTGFGDAFQEYVPQVLPSLLRGLSDEAESVRDVSFRAAQVLVAQYGSSHTALLLPPLEDGIFSPDWRIRQSSVQLIGTLIDQVLKGSGGQGGVHSGDLMASEVLSRERRAYILSSLYIIRSDDNAVVRQCAASVWKGVVSNTPRTLKELLPILMERLIRNLGSNSIEKQRVAGRCLGELVLKLGDRVLPELMPIFMQTLDNPESHTRQGVCIGLAEVIQSAPKTLLTDYIGDLIPAVRHALEDGSRNVRRAATRCVSLLHDAIGITALQQIIPTVLNSICLPPIFPSEGSSVPESRVNLVASVEQLVQLQPYSVLPFILSEVAPSKDGIAVLKGPFDIMKLKVIACAAAAPAAASVHHALSKLVPALLDAIASASVSSDAAQAVIRSEAIETAKKIVVRVEKEGVHLLLGELATALQQSAAQADESAAGLHRHKVLKDKGDEVETDPKHPWIRAAAAELLSIFFATTTVELQSYVPVLLPVLLPLALTDPSPATLEKGSDALASLSKAVKKEDFAPHIPELREGIIRLVTDPVSGKVPKGILLPGLNIKNGLEPLYPQYQHGLMYASAELREASARGMGELIAHTSADALKAYVVKMTGPLIRIVGDRFPATVKAAILGTLQLMLEKGGVHLKPFYPQLQTTFVKCLSDPAPAVRMRGATSLGHLTSLSATGPTAASTVQTRIEPLIVDLCNNVSGAGASGEPGVRTSMVQAVGDVLKRLPVAVSQGTLDRVVASASSMLSSKDCDDEARDKAATCLAAATGKHMEGQAAKQAVAKQVYANADSIDADVRLGASLSLGALLGLAASAGGAGEAKAVWSRVFEGSEDKLVQALTTMLNDDKVQVKKAAVDAFQHSCKLVKSLKSSAYQLSVPAKMLPVVNKSLAASGAAATGATMMVSALKGIKALAKHAPGLVSPEPCADNENCPAIMLSRVVAPLALGVQTTTPVVKLQAERGLFYALRVPQGGEDAALKRLNEKAGQPDGVDAVRLRFLGEYAKRVLSKLNREQSDSEDEV